MLPQSLLFYVFNFGGLEDKDEQKYINSNISAISIQPAKGNNTLKNNFMKDVNLKQFSRNSIEKITYSRKKLTESNIDDELDYQNKKNKKKNKNIIKIKPSTRLLL